ncbi:SWIM zinc finger family protein [Synechococcus sp. PCC 6312]|uniref:SWIM zinc finger family protein n=1 Tax=Synechococcus sp. (strain ATCC 27167 / PCC 6312) TaxID=195253 RepID=UPI00029F0DB3|nr:SWIM zinc finger family protein [Synechococcus sp. PCC 6312]AFY61169.1 SWIM zinc finger-containing protein [Synechococcus sp. PCC 6312]
MTTKTATDLIYTAANAARIMGNKIKGLVIEVWANVVYLHAKGLFSRFASKAAFKHQFVAFRKAGAVGLDVVKVPFETGEYMVCSSSGETAYLVQYLTNKLTCTCQDFQTQAAVMKKACCKHCYATLNHLGYNSLADYVNG